ncbi:hypothetical protein D3C73_1265880 [compost metagenome]
MLRGVRRFRIAEFHTQGLRQLAVSQPTAKTQQGRQPRIHILAWLDRARLLVIEGGQAEMLLFRDEKKAEAGADQRTEAHQAFKCQFKVEARHHRVADDLKGAGMEMPIGLEADVRIPCGLRGQLPQAIEHPSLAPRPGRVGEFQVQPGFPTQTGDIQPLGRERSDQYVGVA